MTKESENEKKVSDIDRGIIFLETLRRSAELAQELFNANREMSLQLKSLESDIASKEARVAFLERETKQLRAGLSRLAIADDRDRSARFESLFEDQNVLAHLFITSDRLARVTSSNDAATAAVEVMHNLVGARRYVIWLFWPDMDSPRELAQDNMTDELYRECLPLAKMALAEKRVKRPEGRQIDQVPVALPMWLGDRVVGVIVIAELVPQRPKLERLHNDLLTLLCERLPRTLGIGATLDRMNRDGDPWSLLKERFERNAK